MMLYAICNAIGAVGSLVGNIGVICAYSSAGKIEDKADALIKAAGGSSSGDK